MPPFYADTAHQPLLLDAIYLGALERHWPWLVAGALASQTVMYASALLSPVVIGRRYRVLSKVKQFDWDMHVVSFVHSALSSYFALDLLNDPVLQADKLWGYTAEAGNVFAAIAGYFVWDIYVCAARFRENGWQMLVHALASFAVFLFGLGPFTFYYGAVFILFELSTPFLNVHWFMDKLGKTGSRMQIANGICLIVTFFFARIFWGTQMSLEYFAMLWANRKDIPVFHLVLYGLSNLILMSFNFLWFTKIVNALRRRIAGERKRPAREVEQVTEAALKLD